MSAVLVTLRRLRQDPAPAVGLGLLVLVTAVVFGLAPRILERVADDSLRKVVADASAFNRNIAVIDEQPIRPGSTADPLSEVASEGDRLTAEMPRSVQALIVDRLTVVDSGRWHIEAPTPDPAFVRFRIQPGAESRIHYVSGHAPTAVVRTIDLPPPATPVPGEDVQPTARVLQVALSVNAVQQIHHGLGETVTLTFDSRDPLVGGPRSGIAAMEIVGVFEVDRPADPFWYEDTALEKVSFRSLGGDSRLIDATALIPADAYEPMLGVVPPDITPVRVTWRSFVGPERMRAGPMNDLIRDLRRLETTFPRSQPATRARDSVAMQSGLLPLIQTHAARWTSALAILTVIAIGPAAVALTALALIAAIVARRRRPALILVRGRGGSVGQIIRAVLLEGLLVCVPALALGIGLAIAALPAADDRPTVIAATVVAILAVGLVVGGALPGTAAATRAGRDGRDGGDGEAQRGPTARRLVFDALVILLAAGGAYLLRDRGVRGSSTVGTLTAADPLIAAVPALAGIAAGLTAIRLVPLPLRVLGRLAAAGRGIVPMLAFRRASQAGTTAALLVVLLTTASIGAFASAALVHLDRTGASSAWQAVGAPFRVTAQTGALPAALDPHALPGVRSVATSFQVTVPFGTSRIPVRLLVVDLPAYAAIIRRSPVDPELPPAMLGPVGDVVPILISSELADRPDGVKLGQRLDILVNAFDFPVQVAAVRRDVPGVSSTGFFAIASREQMLQLHPNLPFAPNVLFLDAPDDAGPAITDAVAAVTPGATVLDRAAIEREFSHSPVTAAIIVGVAIAAIVAGVYAALAVAAALTLAGSARAVELAHLRMLGMSRREALRLAILEHGPTVLLAFVAGLALGLGLFALLEPGLGIDTLVGSQVATPLTADPGQLAIIFVGVLVIAAIGIGLAAWTERRGAPIAALRRGFE